ncbi:MAG: sigma-70 family RNA polymerase sigma factor [Kofleriaceae bacterium]
MRELCGERSERTWLNDEPARVGVSTVRIDAPRVALYGGAVPELVSAFEEHRPHLRSVAYRMLGSRSEADDAVQEAWIKASNAETSDVENLRGWLTTVVARTCLDMLRSRASRREEVLAVAPEPATREERAIDESIAVAALVVLDKLAPVERIAFVLHDLCAMSFDEIAPVVGKTSAAVRQIASRARRRVNGASAPEIDLPAQRRLVEQFIAALRAGDVEALVAVLGGQRAWAEGAIAYRRATEHMVPALIDGRWGLALAPRGNVRRVLVFDFEGETIGTADVVVEAEALAELAIDLTNDRSSDLSTDA